MSSHQTVMCRSIASGNCRNFSASRFCGCAVCRKEVRMTRNIAFVAAVMLASVSAYAQTTYKKDVPTALAKEAKVDEATAAAAARARVPNGTIRSVELEREKGRLIYSYDFVVDGRKGVEEVNVDAASGKVVATEHESAATERTEAAKEATAKKGTKKP